MSQATLAQLQNQANLTLKQVLTRLDEANPLKEALTYSLLAGGKRLRPALTYAIGLGFGRKLEDLHSAAASLELIHTYSLVHDDLPAMDDDDLRRGQATCHKKFDEATAILVGDALQTLAFELLATDEHLTAENKVRAITQLSQAAGAQGMILGQMLDITSENKQISLEELTQLHQGKTGALITAAFLLGAGTEYSEYDAILQELGSSLGLAFQIQDDILDIEGDSQTLGKTSGRDEELNKSTYPKLLGLDKAKAMRDQLIEQAKNAHKKLPFYSQTLAEIINFTANRNH